MAQTNRNAEKCSPLVAQILMYISVCFLSLFLLFPCSPSQGLSVHDSLAVRLCNEILRDPRAPEVRLYTKSLSCLELSSEDSPLRKDLLLLLQEIQQVCLRQKQTNKQTHNATISL